MRWTHMLTQEKSECPSPPPRVNTHLMFSLMFIPQGVRRANAVKYGLAATVWSTDVSTLHTVSQKLHVSFFCFAFGNYV